MVLSYAAAALSTALGTGLGLSGTYRGRALVAVHTFALVAAVTVVVAELLPTAVDGLGAGALLVFVVALAVPSVVERVAGVLGRSHEHATRGGNHDLGLELGYLGLLIHNFGDGLAMGTFGGAHHAGHDHDEIVFGIAAHTVAVTAVIVLAFRECKGPRVAVARAAGLAAAMCGGIVAVGVVPSALVSTLEPWIAAVTGGLLLHVVAHDVPVGSRATSAGRVADLAAVALGVGLILMGSGHEHGHGHEHATARAVGAAFIELLLETAPMLLAGLVAGALVQTLGARLPLGWLRGRSSLTQATAGAIIGAPLPVCACGVLPIAGSLRARGATAAFVVAFLLATPELGVETFALTVQFLGWEFAALRVVAAVTVAIVAAVVAAKFAPRGEPSSSDAAVLPSATTAPTSRFGAWLGAFDELLHHTAPWMLVGLGAAAFLEVSIDPDDVAALAASGLDVFVVSAIAVPSYVCASSATPLAAVLIAKGLSPGAALAGLLLGPATNVATIVFLRRWFGARAGLLGVAALVVATWAFAFGANAWLPAPSAWARAPGEHEHGWLEWAALGLLCVLVVRGVLRNGLASWVSDLVASMVSAGNKDDPHGHAHGHAHGHGHGH